MHHPTDRTAHTTAFVTPVVEHWLEREIAQWVQPMKDRSDDPSHHERTLSPRSYISLPTDTERGLISYRHVRRTACRARPGLRVDQPPADTEVTQLHRALLVQQDVRRLDIWHTQKTRTVT